MLYEYLNENGAIGHDKAISTPAIMAALKLPRRGVVKLVADERRAGCLICNAGAAGGYYIPASDAEIVAQKRRLEKTFISRADAVRVFRRACRDIAKREGAAAYEAAKA